MAMISIGGCGVWSVSSKKDPKWNNSGRGFGAVTNGGPKEMQEWLKECEEKYGETPDDLEVSFFKD